MVGREKAQLSPHPEEHNNSTRWFTHSRYNNAFPNLGRPMNHVQFCLAKWQTGMRWISHYTIGQTM